MQNMEKEKESKANRCNENLVLNLAIKEAFNLKGRDTKIGKDISTTTSSSVPPPVWCVSGFRSQTRKPEC